MTDWKKPIATRDGRKAVLLADMDELPNPEPRLVIAVARDTNWTVVTIHKDHIASEFVNVGWIVWDEHGNVMLVGEDPKRGIVIELRYDGNGVPVSAELTDYSIAPAY